MFALEIPFTKSFADAQSLEKCADDLKALLIVSFETAIDQGLPPHKALAVILEWTAEECTRLNGAASS
jgi:hypothetical protein